MSTFREMYFEGEIDGKGLLDEIDRLRAELEKATAAAVANMSLACQKESEADALRIIADRRLELIRGTLANSEWRHGARNIYAELSKEIRAAMGANA